MICYDATMTQNALLGEMPTNYVLYMEFASQSPHEDFRESAQMNYDSAHEHTSQ